MGMLILNAVGLYLIVGIGYALYFVFIRINRIDTQARNSASGFRLIIFPGAVLLWPVLLFTKKINHS